MIKKDNELGRFVTCIKVKDSIFVDGPAKINLLETNYEGHKNVIKISISAPKSTKIVKSNGNETSGL